MNKKGLTLVELIATLVILSVIALIVAPNIYVSVRDYKEQLHITQMNNIKDSAKNWAADHINDGNFPINNDFSLKVTVQELQEGGYIDENLKDTKGGGTFDESNTFVIIDCDEINDIGEEISSNYKYNYESYYDMDDYYIKSAIEYGKKNIKRVGTSTISVNSLQEKGYIANQIKTTDGSVISIENKTITIKASLSEEDTAEIEFTASI